MMYDEKKYPPSLQEELKKITVWIICNTPMNVAENFTCEKRLLTFLLLTIIVMHYGIEATIK